MDVFRTIARSIKGTPFLLGDGQNGWKVSLDWLIKTRENPLRVLEGHYESRAAEEEGGFTV